MTGLEQRVNGVAEVAWPMPEARGASSGYRRRIAAVLGLTAVAAAPAMIEVKPCEAGLPIEEQKKRLAAIAGAQFSGTTSHDAELPRLHYPPDARDDRSGGIFLSIDFNGDDYDTVALDKDELDRRMRDAYETLYTAGCEDLAIVQLNA